MIGSKNTMDSFEGWKPAGKEAILLSNPNFILITKRATKSYGSLNSFLKESGIEMTEAARTQSEAASPAAVSAVVAAEAQDGDEPSRAA